MESPTASRLRSAASYADLSSATKTQSDHFFRHPSRFSITLLRVGLGLIWAANIVFIADPSNVFFRNFPATAASFAGSAVVGPGLASFVSAHPDGFAAAIAAITIYLAVAFVLGVTTRLACVVGAGFSIVIFLMQFGTTFGMPGGTDVGPHPLYLLLYVALFLGQAGRDWSVDALLVRLGWVRSLRLFGWIGTPSSTPDLAGDRSEASNG